MKNSTRMMDAFLVEFLPPDQTECRRVLEKMEIIIDCFWLFVNQFIPATYQPASRPRATHYARTKRFRELSIVTPARQSKFKNGKQRKEKIRNTCK